MPELTAADRIEIQELLGRYCRVIDLGRWDELPGLFTPDCRLDVGPMGVHEGHAGVRAFAQMLAASGLTMRHYVTNVLTSGDGDRAHVEAHVLAVTGRPGQATPTTGFYEDEVVKVDGRWRFRARRALIDLPG